MHILLDECVDQRLAGHFSPEHTVRTVAGMEWAGLKNGELLDRAQGQFDVFVTTDRNLCFQQNLPKFSLAVLVLKSRSNRLEDLLLLMAEVNQSISALPRGQATEIG